MKSELVFFFHSEKDLQSLESEQAVLPLLKKKRMHHFDFDSDMDFVVEDDDADDHDELGIILPAVVGVVREKLQSFMSQGRREEVKATV